MPIQDVSSAFGCHIFNTLINVVLINLRNVAFGGKTLARCSIGSNSKAVQKGWQANYVALPSKIRRVLYALWRNPSMHCDKLQNEPKIAENVGERNCYNLVLFRTEK